jgi:hypothetical protein
MGETTLLARPFRALKSSLTMFPGWRRPRADSLPWATLGRTFGADREPFRYADKQRKLLLQPNLRVGRVVELIAL